MRPHLPFSCSTRGWVDSQRRVKTRPSRTRSQIPHSRSLLASRVLLCRRQVLAVRVSYAATLHKTPRFGRRQRGPAILCCRPRCPAGDLPTEPWPHPPCPVPYLVSGTYSVQICNYIVRKAMPPRTSAVHESRNQNTCYVPSTRPQHGNQTPGRCFRVTADAAPRCNFPPRPAQAPTTPVRDPATTCSTPVAADNAPLFSGQ